MIQDTNMTKNINVLGIKSILDRHNDENNGNNNNINEFSLYQRDDETLQSETRIDIGTIDIGTETETSDTGNTGTETEIITVTTESLLEEHLCVTKELTQQIASLKYEISEQNISSFKCLSDIKKIELAILKELRDEADEGKRIQVQGKAGHKEFFIIDMQKDPGHKVKSFVLRNDGPEDIFIAYNAALSSIGPSIEDVKNSLIFEKLSKDEDKRYSFNRNVIKNIYILAHKGESKFRCNLAW